MDANKKKKSCLGILQIYFGACFLLFGLLVVIVDLPFRFSAPFLLIGAVLLITATQLFRNWIASLIAARRREKRDPESSEEGTN